MDTAAFSLITPDQTYGLLALFLGLAAFGFWSEKTKLGQLLSGVILVILVGLTLSNLRIIPFAASFYDVVWSYAVPLAIPLLLFRADLRRILPVAGPMLITFVIATLGTIGGVVAGYHLIDLGPQAAKIASILGASWIGGSMNFAATSRALELDDGTLISAMAAADNVGATLFLLLIVTLPMMAGVRKLFPSPIMDAADAAKAEPVADEEETEDGDAHIRLFDLAMLLGLSALCCFLGFLTANFLGGIGAEADMEWLANFSSYGMLFLTLYALVIANVFTKPMERLQGDFQLGMFFMYVFFGVMGAGADVVLMIDTALPVFGFVGIMATVHLLVVLTATKIFKVDLAEAMLVSNAVALGPATAAAQAAAQGWRTLVTPAVMLGVLGYASATFIGVALSQWLAG
ncbi:MAG: DUF819 family protein [Parvibaculaceae bacterium]|nr:DUF819 family protein [Parvibaculaceae bacterium]